jgi:hypothetical protein
MRLYGTKSQLPHVTSEAKAPECTVGDIKDSVLGACDQSKQFLVRVRPTGNL